MSSRKFLQHNLQNSPSNRDSFFGVDLVSLRQPFKNDSGGGNGYGSTQRPSSYEPYHSIINREYDGNLTDEGYEQSDDGRAKSADEFEIKDLYKAARTGRHRRKQAARTKGGEFEASRRKRRLYFCCLGSEIDIQKLHDQLVIEGKWVLKLYGDVLGLFRPNKETPYIKKPAVTRLASYDDADRHSAPVLPIEHFSEFSAKFDADNLDIVDSNNIPISKASSRDKRPLSPPRYHSKPSDETQSYSGTQELYIFEFGATVVWGFSKTETSALIRYLRDYVTRGMLPHSEFEQGEDDIGFIVSSECESISIANDLITLPEVTIEKQRLAVSYAIAQSTILAVFEARVEKKVEEYKYIPETLARSGTIHLPHQKIGRMIGDIFVIRHDLNLHSDILDTPDFFWKEEKVEPEYKMVFRYLEMSGRVEVVNTRLNMLKELLDVLQQQMDNAHAIKLEWIVIWLIVVEILIEVVGILGEVLGVWKLF